jgi:hypothetical protein
MSRRRALTSLVSVLVLGGALGACGSQKSADAANAYVAKLNAAQTRFAQAVAQLPATSSTSEYHRTLERLDGVVVDLVGQLRALAVPDDVRTEHGRLVAAMSGYGDEIADAAQAARSPTADVLADVKRRVSGATITVNTKLRDATTAINDKLHAQ